MAKIKSLNGETMTWLSGCEVMIAFRNGYAEVTDKRQLAELAKRGYNVGVPLNDVTAKQKPNPLKSQEQINGNKNAYNGRITK